MTPQAVLPDGVTAMSSPISPADDLTPGQAASVLAARSGTSNRDRRELVAQNQDLDLVGGVSDRVSRTVQLRTQENTR